MGMGAEKDRGGLVVVWFLLVETRPIVMVEKVESYIFDGKVDCDFAVFRVATCMMRSEVKIRTSTTHAHSPGRKTISSNLSACFGCCCPYLWVVG